MDQFPFDHFLGDENRSNKQNKSNDLNSGSFTSVNFFDDLENSESKLNANKNISNHLNSHTNPQENLSLFSKEEIKEFHKTFLTYLRNNVSQELFNSYFNQNFKIKDVTESQIVFETQNSVTKKIIERSCADVLNEVIKKIFGAHYTFTIEPKEDLSLSEESSNIDDSKSKMINNLSASGFETEPPSFNLRSAHELSVEEEPRTLQFTTNSSNKVPQKSFKLSSSINKTNPIQDKINSEVIKYNNKYSQIVDQNKTFENFIVGPSNNMAHAFAIAVAKNPGVTYPSLFLHGNSGLGKTHLLHAICNKVLDLHPRSRITFTSANGLMNDVIEFTQSNKRHELKKKYIDSTDILIIDDIHELEKRTGTQNEFFHIFNQLQAKKKQLIFTSDKHPKEIDGIEERIRTRLSSALIVEIEKPDFETRVAILKEKAFEHDILLDNDVIRFIASSIKSNIRELEGSLIKLGAYSRLLHKDIDIEIAKEQLKIENDYSENILSVEKVTKIVAAYYKVTVGDIRGKSRLKKVTRARQVAMHLTYEFVSKE
ncbi:chromosomal replication initiator protein DnaA, partial [Bacteriovoracaceae bacterium]|nr:chromosomal replication initiator protein DnaA [Bacteriovoracaceae bacterium]